MAVIKKLLLVTSPVLLAVLAGCASALAQGATPSVTPGASGDPLGPWIEILKSGGPMSVVLFFGVKYLTAMIKKVESTQKDITLLHQKIDKLEIRCDRRHRSPPAKRNHSEVSEGQDTGGKSAGSAHERSSDKYDTPRGCTGTHTGNHTVHLHDHRFQIKPTTDRPKAS